MGNVNKITGLLPQEPRWPVDESVILWKINFQSFCSSFVHVSPQRQSWPQPWQSHQLQQQRQQLGPADIIIIIYLAKIVIIVFDLQTLSLFVLQSCHQIHYCPFLELLALTSARAALAAAASRSSTAWASSAKIWTELSSLMVIEPEETKNFLVAPSSS